MTPRRYLIDCLAVTTLLLGGIAAFNGWVDPWGIHRAGTDQGWNHFKTGRTGAQDRMIKAVQIRELQPEVLLLGSSNTDWKLAPSS